MFAAIVGQSWADDAHPFNLEINGNDYIAKVDRTSIRVEMPGPGTNGSMTFELADASASVTVNEWDEVRLIEHAATPRPILFGGFVQSVRYRVWARGGRTLIVTCVGYGILLDKKVIIDDIVGIIPTPLFWPGLLIASYVGRYGGRVWATGASGGIGTLGVFDQTSEVWGAPHIGNEWIINIFSTTEPSLSVPTTLRSAIEYISGLSINFDPIAGDDLLYPAPFAYWVDSAAHFRMLPILDPRGSAFATHEDQQYDGTVPGFDLDTAGTYIVEGLEYEREDTDRLTTAYVVGGNAAGTGYYRAAPLERAGDLESVLDDDTSLAADDIPSRGGASIGSTAAITATGTAVLRSSSPLAIWPGRQLTVTNPQLSLTSATKFRITSVNIDFLARGQRRYSVAFGGRISQPSAMRRVGKMAFRRR